MWGALTLPMMGQSHGPKSKSSCHTRLTIQAFFISGRRDLREVALWPPQGQSCVLLHSHTWVHTHTHTDRHTYIHIHTNSHSHNHTYTDRHTLMDIHTHIHICSQTLSYTHTYYAKENHFKNKLPVKRCPSYESQTKTVPFLVVKYKMHSDCQPCTFDHLLNVAIEENFLVGQTSDTAWWGQFWEQMFTFSAQLHSVKQTSVDASFCAQHPFKAYEVQPLAPLAHCGLETGVIKNSFWKWKPELTKRPSITRQKLGGVMRHWGDHLVV